MKKLRSLAFSLALTLACAPFCFALGTDTGAPPSANTGNFTHSHPELMFIHSPNEIDGALPSLNSPLFSGGKTIDINDPIIENLSLEILEILSSAPFMPLQEAESEGGNYNSHQEAEQLSFSERIRRNVWLVSQGFFVNRERGACYLFKKLHDLHIKCMYMVTEGPFNPIHSVAFAARDISGHEYWFTYSLADALNTRSVNNADDESYEFQTIDLIRNSLSSKILAHYFNIRTRLQNPNAQSTFKFYAYPDENSSDTLKNLTPIAQFSFC